jgi:CDP-diacylglycerol--glycerol-3-phosphate 3-phosphatidyltransferase/archaetidylinositol phosphate synthase
LHHSRRKFYEEASTHLGFYCLKLGLTPNFLTGVSLLCAILSGVFFWKANLVAGVIFILLTSLTDMLDGATARAGKTGSAFGGILDHVSDRYGEFFILAGIAVSGVVHPLWAITAMFGMIIASYTRAAAESIGKLETCAVGMMGRLEKFIMIIIGALFEKFYPGYNILTYALALVAVTSIITSIQRLVFAKRELNKNQEQ